MMLRQRQPRVTNARFLDFVREHPCCACRAPPPSQAAHLRLASAEHDKRQTGMGERPDDRWAVPLCAACHLDGQMSVHRTSERRFFERAGVDPFKIAVRLWEQFNGVQPTEA